MAGEIHILGEEPLSLLFVDRMLKVITPKVVAGSCMLVLTIIKPRDFKSPYR